MYSQKDCKCQVHNQYIIICKLLILWDSYVSLLHINKAINKCRIITVLSRSIRLMHGLFSYRHLEGIAGKVPVPLSCMCTHTGHCILSLLCIFLSDILRCVLEIIFYNSKLPVKLTDRFKIFKIFSVKLIISIWFIHIHSFFFI